ncbi:MAG: hypothetical protein QW835_02635 [Candidatus Hadarchaeum sp.]
MEVVTLPGLYKRWPTKYYIGFKEGKLDARTRKRELDVVLGIEIVRGRSSRALAYCREHKHLIRCSSLGIRHQAAEKAANCTELDFFEKCLLLNRSFGEAVSKGDLQDAARKLKRIRRLGLAREMRSELAARFSSMPEFADFEARLVLHKLKGGVET